MQSSDDHIYEEIDSGRVVSASVQLDTESVDIHEMLYQEVGIHSQVSVGRDELASS